MSKPDYNADENVWSYFDQEVANVAFMPNLADGLYADVIHVSTDVLSDEESMSTTTDPDSMLRDIEKLGSQRRRSSILLCSRAGIETCEDSMQVIQFQSLDDMLANLCMVQAGPETELPETEQCRVQDSGSTVAQATEALEALIALEDSLSPEDGTKAPEPASCSLCKSQVPSERIPCEPPQPKAFTIDASGQLQAIPSLTPGPRPIRKSVPGSRTTPIILSKSEPKKKPKFRTHRRSLVLQQRVSHPNVTFNDEAETQRFDHRAPPSHATCTPSTVQRLSNKPSKLRARLSRSKRRTAKQHPHTLQLRFRCIDADGMGCEFRPPATMPVPLPPSDGTSPQDTEQQLPLLIGTASAAASVARRGVWREAPSYVRFRVMDHGKDGKELVDCDELTGPWGFRRWIMFEPGDRWAWDHLGYEYARFLEMCAGLRREREGLGRVCVQVKGRKRWWRRRVENGEEVRRRLDQGKKFPMVEMLWD